MAHSPAGKSASIPVPAQKQLHAWMRLAIEQAELALAAADVPIGAVVLDSTGTVIGAGFNERELTSDPTSHAEVLALRRAAATRTAAGDADGWRLADCTLVVTLEPCPMCAGALLLARIPRVVFGAWDDKAGACGSVVDLAREPRFNHQVEVIPGILADETAQLLTDFFDQHRGV